MYAMEGKASFGQVLAYCWSPLKAVMGKEGWCTPGFGVSLGPRLWLCVTQHYRWVKVLLAKLYRCLRRFPFGETYSNGLMGNNGKQRNGLFLKEVSLKGSLGIIWEITSLWQSFTRRTVPAGTHSFSHKGLMVVPYYYRCLISISRPAYSWVGMRGVGGKGRSLVF